MVRGTRGPDHPAVRCSQTGHLRRVLRGHQSSERTRRQDPGGPQQGRPGRRMRVMKAVRTAPGSCSQVMQCSSPAPSGGHAAADAGVRRPHVVAGEGD